MDTPAITHSTKIAPQAIYRLQFSESFGFADAIKHLNYFKALGISDIYASPIFTARKGSGNSYDIIDPTNIDPVPGGNEGFANLCQHLHSRGMGLLLDIVPNHMDASTENPWWKDVIEKGAKSRYARVFDLNWLAFNDERDTPGIHRKFFDIAGLVGVRVEDPEVFRLTHSLVLQLIAEGKISGLRIDHIDGLWDPYQYLERLQKSASQEAKKGIYIIIEKILSGEEYLKPSWPVAGTTGYDFMRIVTGLFVDRQGWLDLNRINESITEDNTSFQNTAYEKKKQGMKDLFSPEIQALGRRLAVLSGLSEIEAIEILTEITARLLVYRTYVRELTMQDDDRKYILEAIQASAKSLDRLAALAERIQNGMLLNFPPESDGSIAKQWLDFIMRWQQLTGAVTAKGVEDTALYTYNCLISLNEVGNSPDSGGFTDTELHSWNKQRATKWPAAMNATSTHDTKRSEDVRARINVLSEMPNEWERHLYFWIESNKKHKIEINGRKMPDFNTEIHFYQTLLGAWPLESNDVVEFHHRLKGYMLKAIREAKTFTSWLKQESTYEDAVMCFIDSTLADQDFLNDFLPFQKRIARIGCLNSLSQVILKVACPGVPDFYQGNELWNFSLTDPDNRRRVDFEKAERMLAEIIKNPINLDAMVDSWPDGKIKLYTTYKALELRHRYPNIFSAGDYIPLKTQGEAADCAIAFLRRFNEEKVLCAAARFYARHTGSANVLVDEKVWHGNSIILPRELANSKWLNIFSGESVTASGTILPLNVVFKSFPGALLAAG